MLSRLKKIADYLTDRYLRLLAVLLRFRINKVDRGAYIQKIILRYCPDDDGTLLEQAIRKSPSAVLPEKQCKKAYRSIIVKSGWIVFISSFALTLVPDILWVNILAAVADLAIFQSVLYIDMQKIMILYSQECDIKTKEKESVERMIAIDSSGLMLGKYPLLQKMKSVLGWLGKQIVKRVGPQLVAKLSRYAFTAIRRQTVKWLSVIVTKENLTLAFDALVPITCAAISGLVSVVILIPMCNKLRKHLVAAANEEQPAEGNVEQLVEA